MSQVTLVAFSHSDCGQLRQWVNHQGEPFFYQWGGAAVFRFPLDDLQLQAHVDTAVGENPQRRLYKAVDDGGQMIGYLELNRIDYPSKSALVSRVLVGRRVDRGKGIGFHMVGSLLPLAFNDLGLRSLSLEVFDFNHGAIRCYEKHGFIRDGERQVRLKDACWRSIRMHLSREQWA